jgi:hypothetical protein
MGGEYWEIRVIFGGLILLAMPGAVLSSSYAQMSAPLAPEAEPPSSPSFLVTTNKIIYVTSDRVIVAGTAERQNAENYVSIDILKENSTCAKQVIRLERDGSFISRSIELPCGIGGYLVVAHHAGQTALANFMVVKENAEQSIEMMQIKNTLEQSMDKVKERIRELADEGAPIPNQAIEKYKLGVSEASLVIYFMHYGRSKSVQSHLYEALGNFTQSQEILSPDKVKILPMAKFEDVASSTSDRLDRLSNIYHTLADLAERNGVADSIFDDISSLLGEAKRLINLEELDSAGSALNLAESLVGKARSKLVHLASEVDDNNKGNFQDKDHQVKGLLAAANRLEKRAAKQLSVEKQNQMAIDRINEAMTFISKSRSAIADGDYGYARGLLSSASKLLIDQGRRY